MKWQVELLQESYLGNVNMKGQRDRQEFSFNKMKVLVLGKELVLGF